MIGFSITDVVKSAVTAPLKIAANPAVRSATLTALKNNQYTSGYAQYADLADKTTWRDRGQVRPLPNRPPPMPMMPMPQMPMEDEGGGGGPVQQGNLLMIGGVVVAGLLLFMLVRK